MIKLKKKSLLIAGVIALSSFTALKFVLDKNQVIVDVLIPGLKQLHYSPVEINDEFSEKAYNLYLKNIDRNKLFMLQSDVDQLAKYRKDVDNQINEGHFELYKTSVDILNKRIKEKEAWYKELLSKPFDYSVDEEYETDFKKTKYCASEAELKNEWRKLLKYQTLSRIDDALNRQEKAKEKNDTAVKIRTYDSIEVDARRKTLKANNDYFKYLNKMSSKERFGMFLNSITGTYDPHTEYFAPKDRKKFNESMSGGFEGIGARLESKDGILRVKEVMMGSPSFKQGELKSGDEIHKVAQGAAEPTDITTMDMDDAIDLIKGKKGSEVRLTVKKPDGTFKVIPIIRDVIPLEEALARSALLTNGKSKIGYIFLLNFYTNFDHKIDPKDIHKCATDVKNEIEKLKKYNIDGLILDIRDNGGGSLQEVVDMAGLFIEKGPIVQQRGRNNMTSVLEDRDTSVTWRGPLSIMINRNSASASEILAAAVQDYKRGVIVGTNSFGKGTVQSFLELDPYVLPQFDTMKPLGSVKITMQKFYRINGGATQLKGVTPDVSFPDPYEFIDYGEKEMDYPMAWDEMEKANYTPFNILNYDAIRKNSIARQKANASFKLIEAQAKEYKAKRDDSKYNLSMEKYRTEQKTLRDQNKKYEDFKKDIKDFTAELLPEDKNSMKADTARLGREERWAKSLAKDVYVHETSNILMDARWSPSALPSKGSITKAGSKGNSGVAGQ
jgi:carboxyl-terminal processing protease